MSEAIAQGKKVVVYQPKDPAGLSRVLIVFLWVDLAVSALGAVGDMFHMAFLASLSPDTSASSGSFLPGEELSGSLQGLVGLIQFALFVVCGFLCLKWIYRTSLNAHVLADGMTNTPGWSVGWFFVPFANLYKPFQGVRETWGVSADPAAWRGVAAAPLLRWWWGCWLADNILGNLSFRLQAAATTAGGSFASDVAQFGADALNVPLDLLFIVIVRRLSAMQVDALSRRVFD